MSISNKCLNLDKAIVKLFCINKEDDIVLCDSIDINNDNIWVTKSISFPMEETQKIILGIYAFGYNYPSSNAFEQQKLWLDKLSIHSSSGELWKDDNSQFVVNEHVDIKYSIELRSPFDLSVQKIEIPDNKMIIGIGEAVHGSKTINQIELGLVKNLILHKTCKLVLFEWDMFQIMIWNQYVQGKLSENYISEIKKELLSTFFSPEEVGNFLVWLRRYNQNTDIKVNIQGLVPFKYGWGNQLFHYLYLFYNSSTAPTIASLLRKMSLETLSDALISTKELRSSLEAIMGSREYAMFLYTLNIAVNNNVKKENQIKSFDLFLHRDFLMSENVNRFVSLYLEDDQKACIIAHNMHINKKLCPFNFPYLHPMGYYLNQRYRDKYYALGIFPGDGSIFIGTDDSWGEMSHLGPILPNSLEDICTQTGFSSFFYSMDYFKNNQIFYRSIGNKHITNEYTLGNLKSQMDGIIFMNKITPVHTDKFDIREGNLVPEMFMRQFEILKNIQEEISQ